MIKLFRNPIKQIQRENKMVVLKPVEPNVSLEEDLQQALSLLFKKLYQPLAKILVEEGLAEYQINVLNSRYGLLQAIKSNKLLYDGSGFVYTSGYKPNTQITKDLQRLGAIFSKAQNKWYVAPEFLSLEIVETINTISLIQNSLTNKLADYTTSLNNLNYILIQDFKTRFQDIYYNIINNVIRQSKTNLIEEGISINLKFDKKITEQIAQDYTNNLDLYIKNFTNTQINQLRQIIEKNVNQGLRKEMLIEEIQEKFNISKSKAKFLARQETALLTSNIQKQNMQRAGIEYYMWDSSRDNKVRPDHAELNGKIFRFDTPPVVNQKTGARANAGEDFGCRCVQRPVIVNIENLRPFYENGYTYYKFVG